ncbi:MAG: chitosanase [Lentisphaerae bacterium]|nr:chitosanase [Lentisphaerota bacterium]
MRIIALADAQSRGKSTSIKLAKEMFIKNFFSKSPIEFANGTEDDSYDIRIAIKLADGYRIAFCSGGDDAAVVAENYQFAVHNQCNLLVTAARGPSRSDSWHKIAQLIHYTPGNDGVLVKAIDFWRGDSPLFLDTANKHKKMSELTAKHLINIIEYALSNS